MYQEYEQGYKQRKGKGNVPQHKINKKKAFKKKQTEKEKQKCFACGC